jgi:hypothetical protein
VRDQRRGSSHSLQPRMVYDVAVCWVELSCQCCPMITKQYMEALSASETRSIHLMGI